MVDPTPSDYNLTYLRERWERDRSSRIFLQLAEEYRRRGLHAEALEVLETGLGFHPGYLAAQVALGRCRLEAGQPEAAIKVLERVLTQDPTQAVATRLLAESWLQLGDEDRTQAAIDRCRLIGIPPSELVGLEQRLAAARRTARESWADPITAHAPTANSGAPAAEKVEEASFAWQPEPEQPAAAMESSPWQSPALATAATNAGPASTAPSSQPVGGVESSPLATASEPMPARESAAAPERAALREPAAVREAAAVREPAAAQAPAAFGAAAASAAAAEIRPTPGHVFSLPQRASRGVVLPLRPGAERRVVGGRANPFASLGRPRPRPPGRPEAAEIFRLVPPPAPQTETEPAGRVAAVAAPPEVAVPQVAAQRAASPESVAAQLTASPATAAPAADDRWWTSRATPAEPAPAAAAPPRPAIPPPPPAPPAAAQRSATPDAARWWERPTETAAPAPPAAAATLPPVASPAPTAPAPAALPPPAIASSVPSPAAVPAPPPAAAAPPSRSPLAASAGVEVQPSGNLGTVASPELRPSDPGTATLGELYLRQGYVREAEEIFKQVLARDAENEAALAGLEAIGRRRTQKLTAAELIAGEETTEVRGLTARKIQLLTRYLGKLRGPRAKTADVPRTSQ